ncbi:MAG: GntR family transcriptional regulator [Sedimenticola sp.]
MQIKEFLVAKISGGEWLPGQIIPSEIQLAQELEVSQGTVRKAITELVENNVLTRKQGRGTFVATHDNQRALFHFFHIADNKGNKVLPGSTTLSCRRRRASSIEASMLQLPAGSRIIYIERVRMFNALPTMVEKIVLPSELFGDLGKAGTHNLPNNLYELYEKKYGITIHNAEEKLRAVPASEQNASLLDLQPGTPLLEIERVAMTLSRTPVEFRISHCNTDNHHYQNTIF